MSIIFNDKIIFFQEAINNIQIAINKYKCLEILNTNEYNFCLENIEKIINNINNISEENIINELQNINNNISFLIKSYGIYSLVNLIKICLNKDFIKNNFENNSFSHKFDIIKDFLHPINYKILVWNNRQNNININKEIPKNKIIDDKMIIEDTNNLECFDLFRSTTNFNLKIYGIKLIIHDYSNKKTLVVNCVFDDILLSNINMPYIINYKEKLKCYINVNELYKNELYIESAWNNFINNLSLKEFLIYNYNELFNKYIYIMSQISSIEQKSINSLVQEFIGNELFSQRATLIHLLLNNDKQEFQYIAYLLYDLLSSDTDTSNDSNEQKIIYNSLPWNCKKLFKNAMCKTVEYTNNLSNFDNNKIPLEQQICLMKVNDNVKEKAMQKLKEIKAKSEDSGSKARNYLDGLLKIPFGIYKEEYILKKKNEIINIYSKLIKLNDIKNHKLHSILNKNKQNEIVLIKLLDNINKNLIEDDNLISISKTINNIRNEYYENYSIIIEYTLQILLKNKKNVLIYFLNQLNSLCEKYNLFNKKNNNNRNLEIIKVNIKDCFEKILVSNNKNLMNEFLIINNEILSNNQQDSYLLHMDKFFNDITCKNNEITEYISSFNDILDSSIYGHKNAKKQIERILGQWINGEKSGYCFGFEGPPGVGKTSLAKKGIAKCLKDMDGESRPLAFIALGGSTNGSILDGHNYTYVGSTWGKIVDILIDKKCMNPIIFIDELDKVSRTEHGKEIIGILTHLIDTTQNDSFQDKYFSIDLDLSKALFIFSYNDVDLIDKILLDRIHRIKFDNLLLDDKLIITKDYLLPELYTKFGLINTINISDEIIKYIIEKYTNEPGVRKLKEILFEIISTINLDLLKNCNQYELPINIEKNKVQDILSERHEISFLKINDKSNVGIINGMWANAYGNSGILHIECRFFSTMNLLELKLTGMQGDVMKESMSVAKTLAISLLPQSIVKNHMKNFKDTKLQGIHIHVPEGSTPKDGPSAGAAITLVIYSLLMNKKIKNNYAITGEICLQGRVTKIGGLDLKILGGIKAGVENFLYPKENNKEFNLFYEKNKEKLEKYNFYEIEDIQDVIKYMIE